MCESPSKTTTVPVSVSSPSGRGPKARSLARERPSSRASVKRWAPGEPLGTRLAGVALLPVAAAAAG